MWIDKEKQVFLKTVFWPVLLNQQLPICGLGGIVDVFHDFGTYY